MLSSAVNADVVVVVVAPLLSRLCSRAPVPVFGSHSALMPLSRPGEPANFLLLHRICKVVVLLCFLHISVTVVFYVRSLDTRFAFVQNQQYHGNVTQRNQVTVTALNQTHGPAETPQQEPEPGERKLEKCPETSPRLVGPMRVEFNIPVSLEQIKKDNMDVRLGGRFTPSECEAQQRVAVIIPFRKREEHLKYWLYYLHPVLQRQQLDYGVYVINQDGDQIFNRAKLLNVGYMEALKDYDYDCFVFSDVDLIPMDDRNTYKCFHQPRHLSVAMDKFGFRLPYYQYFGGVSSMSKEQYVKINGFPNNYWGWGGEDDDIYNRLVSRGMSISRPSGEVGNCRMIRHKRDDKNDPNPQRFDRIAHTRDTMMKDGINSLSYSVVKTERFDLFTKVTVDIGKP